MTYNLYNEDCLAGLDKIPDESIDLIVTDPPYCLGKDYGNDSDKMEADDYLQWTQNWIEKAIPKLKITGSFYIFLTWQYSPEIFSFIKTKMLMMNEIIWDRRVPSMGGSTRKFTSVHDNIGFFVRDKKNYYFDIDAVRIPYDAVTKKARTRSIFKGAKWLEIGYNPKDVWSISRLHKQHAERENHPTQKPLELIERIVKSSCPEHGTVLDLFAGSGTTLEASIKNNRKTIGFEINQHYCAIIEQRLANVNSQQKILPNILAKSF
ncbi:MAG: site-specific DNA-methyltransferase [Alphaproteobacteria bacterium]|nr:site-specific DNA-methyltransferase [Alphaproteobacteria bacterium]